jgi:hypothetical protein
MIGIIFLLGAALLGFGVIRRLPATRLSHGERISWGLVIGWTAVTAAAYAFVRLTAGLSFRVAVVFTFFVWCVALVSWLPDIQRLSRRDGRGPSLRWDKTFVPLTLILCLFAPIYLHLFRTHMLPVGADGGIYSGGESTSYDMAYHAAITNAFAYGDNFPPVYTPMPPAPLLYPFLPDFLTAFLIALGMNLHSALAWTAVPLCVALTGIFYSLALRLLRPGTSIRAIEPGLHWTAAIATLLFFLNGGLGFIYFFQDWRASGTSLWRFLAHLEVNYTHIAAKGLVWPNVVTDMLLSQRTSIFGLSLGFIILTCFAIAWRETDDALETSKRGSWQFLLTAGLLAGSLPFFHLHSYAAVGLISGFLFLLRPRRVWLFFFVPAVVLAIPRLVKLCGPLASSGFIRFQPGWRGQGEPSWLLFWLRNLGVPAILVIPAWLVASKSLRRFYLPFLVLLISSLLVVVSPNDYDNLKLMAYWYAGTCVVIAGMLLRLARTRSGLVCSVIAVLICIASGMLAILYESRASKRVFTREEIGAAEFVKKETGPHSLFLTAPDLHQPVLSLAGRAIVRGPTAWLWSHGYPFAEREADVRAIYVGREDALDLLRYYGVDYVYLGPRELAEFKANKDFFDASFPVVYRAGDTAIYRIINAEGNEPARSSPYPAREYAARIDRDPSQILVEFPTIAFELYRLRKAAFGAVPKYAEFMSDLRQLGRQLYPGSVGWREVLEKNKQTLVEGWRAHPDLTSRSETRADYNEAYVLCHYFAYLRRDPGDAPDHDLTGYKFWLAQLDRTRDYRGITRAFLESDEYKSQTR